MKKHANRFGIATLFAAILVAGCDKGRTNSDQSGAQVDRPGATQEDPTNATNGGEESVPDEVTPVARKPREPIVLPISPMVTATKPVVIMSVTHDKMCLAKLDSVMPSITLPDAAGNQQTLANLYGPKLTVVVFWKADRVYALEQFTRLNREVVAPHQQHGVQVIAVSEGDSAEVVQQLADKAGAEFPVLLDTDGAALSQVATGQLPRTYLLDSTGKILWMDIEYSRSTRRDLENAINWHLKGQDAVTSLKST